MDISPKLLKILEDRGDIGTYKSAEYVITTISSHDIYWDHGLPLGDHPYQHYMSTKAIATYDPDRWNSIKEHADWRHLRQSCPKRYIRLHYATCTQPLRFAHWEPTLSIWAPSLRGHANCECDIVRVVTAAYLPIDTPFLLQVGDYHHYIDGNCNPGLSTMLEQARALPSGADLTTVVELGALPRCFPQADTFWQHGIEYRKMALIYPFFTAAFGHFISLRPLDIQDGCDIYIEFADIYEGTDEYNQLISAKITREEEEIKLTGVTGDGKHSMSMQITYDPRYYPGKISGACFHDLPVDDAAQNWFRDITSLNDEFFNC